MWAVFYKQYDKYHWFIKNVSYNVILQKNYLTMWVVFYKQYNKDDWFIKNVSSSTSHKITLLLGEWCFINSIIKIIDILRI